MTEPRADRPNAVPWPPILYLGALGAAVLLGMVAPLPGHGAWSILSAPGLAGMVLVAAGLGLVVWAIRVMLRRGANVSPHRAATHLLETGPFARSRNPIYLGDTLVLLGLWLVLANPWFVLAAVFAAVAVHHLAILREEVHLAARFGDAYADYMRRVPRWIGRPRH